MNSTPTPTLELGLDIFGDVTVDADARLVSQAQEAVRHAAKLEGVRLHDLRHSFASVGASGGLSLPMIGALLGHREVSTTQRYAHLGDDPRKAAADRVAAEIAAAMRETEEPERPALTIAR